MDVIQINDSMIGRNQPCYIIAEMSANHSGDLPRALDIIHAAHESGADCLKIQTYTADTLTIDCNNEYFQIKNGLWKGQNLYQLYNQAYTPWEWQARLKEETEKLGMDFLSTPFDNTAVDFLEQLGIAFYKIASFEMNDIPFIKYVASKGKPMIVSTGMANLGEIEETVSAIREMGNEQLCLLKCSSAYPAIPNDMNLRTIPHLAETFKVPIGLSDHSMGSMAAVTAVAVGASVIEKHFCLSRQDNSADAAFSMEPVEFRQMVDDIRQVEKALGAVSYDSSPDEMASKKFRRSLFAIADVKQGELFTPANIRSIRPADGLEPKYYPEVIGKRAACNVSRGTPLRWNMITE